MGSAAVGWLPEAGRLAAVTRVWSRKEAYLESIGVARGVAEPYVGSLTEPAAVAGWILGDVQGLARHAAALALAAS